MLPKCSISYLLCKYIHKQEINSLFANSYENGCREQEKSELTFSTAIFRQNMHSKCSKEKLNLSHTMVKYSCNCLNSIVLFLSLVFTAWILLYCRDWWTESDCVGSKTEISRSIQNLCLNTMVRINILWSRTSSSVPKTVSYNSDGDVLELYLWTTLDRHLTTTT